MKMLTAFLLIGLALGGAPAADLTGTAFPCLKLIHPPAQLTNAVAAFELDADVFAVADTRFANLRIFDQALRETPFWLRRKSPPKTVCHENLFQPQVLSFQELPENRIEIVIARNPDQPRPAALRLQTTQRNFEKQVAVAGSDDRTNWIGLAANAPIFDYSRFIDVRNDRVSLAATNFLYYRVEISNITETRDSPLTEIIRRAGATVADAEITSFRREVFRIDRVSFIERVESVVEGEVETQAIELADWKTQPDVKRRLTLVDIRAARQPLVAIELQTEDANFSRAVTLEGADDEQGREWRGLASGRLSRVNVGWFRQQNMALTFPESRCRHYRLTIANENNPVLNIARVMAKANKVEIFFLPKPGGQYRLFYGGENIPAPRYEVAAVFNDAPAGGAALWSLGAETPNPAFKPHLELPAAIGKGLFMAALSVMVAILAWMIVRTSRKIDRLGDQPRGGRSEE